MEQDNDKSGTENGSDSDPEDRAEPREQAVLASDVGLVIENPSKQQAQGPADKEDKKRNRNHEDNSFHVTEKSRPTRAATNKLRQRDAGSSSSSRPLFYVRSAPHPRGCTGTGMLLQHTCNSNMDNRSRFPQDRIRVFS